MRILYIAPENVVGNLNLWQEIHRDRGHECRYITYFPSRFGYPEDICLNLPLVAPNPWFLWLRRFIYQMTGGPQQEIELEGCPPVWEPKNAAVRQFFRRRDRLWTSYIEPLIQQHHLLDFDIYQLETGLEFYRDGRFIRQAAKRGKLIFNTFHGIELRHRGIIPAVDQHIALNLTSELDLIPRHPNLKYLYLPFDTDRFQPVYKLHDPITICHATRNRYFKGSDEIIAVCRNLEKTHGIRFILIEDLPHSDAMRLKKEADIYIDQVANVAPGYGMNSIEAMSMGTVCCTNMDEQYSAFMPDHPFVHVTPDTLRESLTALIENPESIIVKSQIAREWVEQHHSKQAAGDQLYRYYAEFGINT